MPGTWACRFPGVPKGDHGYVRHEVKRLMLEVGLRLELSFTSFRHDEITEGTGSDLIDREIQSIRTRKRSQCCRAI